jgi:hypothetical protein
MAAKKKAPARKKKEPAKPQRGEEGFKEPELTKAQKAAPSAGRTVEKDRTERSSAKPSKAPGFDSETPSAKALAEVGEGPEVKHNNVEQVLAHGEKYQAAKRKHRWG